MMSVSTQAFGLFRMSNLYAPRASFISLKTRSRNQRALAELSDGIVQVEPALKELALLLGISEADKLPPEVLLAGIQDEIEKRSEAWRKSPRSRRS
jgi:hypothetical protein